MEETSTGVQRAENYPRASQGWFAVGVLSALYACSFIDRQIIALMVVPIQRDLALSDTQMSLLLGPAFAIFFALMGLPMGALVDRVSRKGVIATGVAAWSLFTAGCGLSSSYAQLFLMRMGVGVGEATLGPGAYSMITDYFRASHLSRAMSVFGLGVVFGSGLASIIGGYVIEASMSVGAVAVPLLGVLRPWQVVFVSVGLPGLLLAALMMAVREPPRRAPVAAVEAGGLWRQLSRRRHAYLALMGGFGLFSLFGYGAGAWLPTYLMRSHGFPVHQVGLLIGLGTIILGASGTLFWGAFNDRLVSRGRRDAPFVLGPVIGLGLGVAGVTMGLASSHALVIAGVLLFALFGAVWSGITAASLQLMTPGRLRGRVSAVYLIVNNAVGLGVGPLLIALVTDRLFGDPLAVGKSIALVGGVVLSIAILLLMSGRKAYLAALDEEAGAAVEAIRA
ncbi:MFS transporter [Sphingomonas colocasiae]|uniref:MFS transporter n=1 Tax=Sphingomonas colocasiae TaxID=1848973 RepID=A0ABS7PVL1_9SPHN|nr:MFS transporter [Sphingomonas colocasiae]MBY8825401.1 MFS transporter [Sphingomonas colocasiae]